MKKIYSSFLALFAAVAVSAQCTIDQSNTQFLAPTPDQLPCIERGNSYSETLQIAVPSSIDLSTLVPGLPLPISVNVDSVVITGVQGLPAGITYVTNPASGVFPGGQKGCALLSGTTNAQTGNYPLSFEGTITLSGLPQIPGFPVPADTTVDLATLQSLPQNPLQLFVDVIEPGEPCRTSGIKGFNADLNAAINVFPNPSNGVFEFTLNANRRVNGTLNVTDVNGRVVFTTAIDAVGRYNQTINLTNLPKGIYNLQLNTAEGFAAKTISVQ